MQGNEGDPTVRVLEGLFDGGSVGGLPDGDLLDRFVAQREEAVFAALVHRHGSMVWGVCRRVLRDHHHAEDAFQATFLVLARRAAAVNPSSRVGPWLHGVALQTALKARATEARRQLREQQIARRTGLGATPTEPDERLGALDGEIRRLPDRYRLPIVHCELEGKTHQETADLLGWPIGTVSGRLARARGILAERLNRQARHLTWLGVLGQRANVPAGLVSTTTQALSALSGRRAGVVSAEVVALMEGVIRSMILLKIRLGLVVVLGLGLVAGGASLAYQAEADEPQRPQLLAQNPPSQPKVERPSRLANGLDAVQPPAQKVDAADPKATYPFTIDSERIYRFANLRVESKEKAFLIQGNNVLVLPMITERGITGAMLIGFLSFTYTPEPGKEFQSDVSAAMLRFHPDAVPLGLTFDADKKVGNSAPPTRISDKGLAEMARHLLAVTVRRCFQRNYVKDGMRKQEVMIPPLDAFAAVVYAREYGEILVSFGPKVAIVHDFTGDKALYEKP